MARAIDFHYPVESVREGAFWKSAVIAGLVGGLVFLIAEMLLVMAVGQRPWGPPRMIAAMALGSDVLPPPASFDAGIVVTALIIHFVLAIIYGIITGWIVQRNAPGNAIWIGAIIGLVIYLLNFHVIASFAFEWFAAARNWVTIVAHLLFGATTAWVFAAMMRRQPHETRHEERHQP